MPFSAAHSFACFHEENLTQFNLESALFPALSKHTRSSPALEERVDVTTNWDSLPMINSFRVNSDQSSVPWPIGPLIRHSFPYFWIEVPNTSITCQSLQIWFTCENWGLIAVVPGLKFGDTLELFQVSCLQPSTPTSCVFIQIRKARTLIARAVHQRYWWVSIKCAASSHLCAFAKNREPWKKFPQSFWDKNCCNLNRLTTVSIVFSTPLVDGLAWKRPLFCFSYFHSHFISIILRQYIVCDLVLTHNVKIFIFISKESNFLVKSIIFLVGAFGAWAMFFYRLYKEWWYNIRSQRY